MSPARRPYCTAFSWPSLAGWPARSALARLAVGELAALPQRAEQLGFLRDAMTQGAIVAIDLNSVLRRRRCLLERRPRQLSPGGQSGRAVRDARVPPSGACSKPRWAAGQPSTSGAAAAALLAAAAAEAAAPAAISSQRARSSFVGGCRACRPRRRPRGGTQAGKLRERPCAEHTHAAHECL